MGAVGARSCGHLAVLQLDALRASGGFYKVTDVSEDIAFLQLTAGPKDALGPDFDDWLESARALLAPILMDLRGVNLG